MENRSNVRYKVQRNPFVSLIGENLPGHKECCTVSFEIATLAVNFTGMS